MMKEYIIIGGIVVAGAIIYAIVRYKNSNRDKGIEIERVYVDVLNVGEVKKWFSEKLTSENVQGILLYPTSEYIKKWNIKLTETNENMLIQAAYDNEKDSVVEYREVSFDTLSEGLKKMLDDNGGCVVIEK